MQSSARGRACLKSKIFPLLHVLFLFTFCYAVWKKKQLDLYEPFKSLMYVYFEVLPLLTFGYISGPFKGYIVRYGYDASLHPESRFLQVVHYRMNKREFYNVKQR